MSLCPVCLEALLPYQNTTLSSHILGERLYSVDIPLRHCVALFGYRSTGIIHTLIHQVKYHSDRTLAKALGQLMAREIVGEGWHFDTICPIPLHPKRKLKRGFNQSMILCEELGIHLGIPVHSLLKRTKNTKTQTRMTAQQRETNIRSAFGTKAITLDPKEPIHILLVDDIVTTGSTVKEAASLLHQNFNCTISIGTLAVSLL